MERANELDTACLPPGTRVGPWYVVERRGRGSYGTVYLAVRMGQQAAGPVALKLALHPEDPRFAREVELLARIQHPGVPRLHDSGHWQHPAGTSYPYVAMQWVEGTDLYEWAEQHAPSSRQVLRLLAQLARALEATHAAGGLHRDVKGANVRVRDEDGHVFLTDFGAGHYQGAVTLTFQALPPGTPAYRSPEAQRCLARSAPRGHYSPGPADDVFALGVTAYRLATGEYPPSTHPDDDEGLIWGPRGVGPRAPLVLNRQCVPELSALILQMLSVRPEARGSARELAESLDDCARGVGPEADRPHTSPLLWGRPLARPAQARALPTRARVLPAPATPRPPPRRWRAALTAAAMVLAVTVGAGSLRPTPSVAEWLNWRADEEIDGTVAIGDSAVAGPTDSVVPSAAGKPIARKMPSKPFPGQVRPDARGHCSSGFEVIHGACWVPVKLNPEQCKKSGYEHKDGCYLPVMPPARPPVSSNAPGGTQP